jgi:hypothetical protein
VLAGPTDRSEGPRGPAWTNRDQPVSSVGGRTEHRVSPAQSAKRGDKVGRAGIGNVSADYRDAAPAETLQRAFHALTQVAVALGACDWCERKNNPGPVGRCRENCAKAAIGFQAARQPGDCRFLESQRGTGTDISRKPSLDRPEPRRSCEDHDGVFHW